MTLAELLLVLAVSCAFLMGFAVNQGSTCAVTAIRLLVHERQGMMLAGFVVVVGVAGLICLPLAWLGGEGVHLAANAPLSAAVALGAVLLGVGAVLNDACLFGTLSRIGQGEGRFLALPLGLAIGYAAVSRQSLLRAPAVTASHFDKPSLLGLILLAVFALALVGAYRLMICNAPPVQPTGRWPLQRAMLVLGVCGALLFVLAPGWTYADAVRRGVAPGSTMEMIGVGAVLSSCAAVAGAVCSGVVEHSFRWRRPSLAQFSASLAGGAMMAVGSTLVPGGNDTLLLSSMPSAAISGYFAFAVMAVSVAVLVAALRWVSRLRQGSD